MKDLKDFKFLVIGLGSMGKRRIRNLLYHGIKAEKIFGFDPREDRCEESKTKHSIKTFRSFNAALQTNPNAYIISTPADKHYIYFLNAIKNRKHFFVEHPVTDRGYKEILNLKDKSLIAAPSCTLRFHPGVKEIKKILDKKSIGQIISFQYHLGQYLPSWHPWEDFREVYFAKKNTGACREMFGFELVWLTFALGLGDISKITGFTEKLSDLDMKADDRYSALLKFKNKISGNIVIDLISKKPFRTLRVVGSEGVLEWEWQENKIKVFKLKKVDNNSDYKWHIIDLKKGRSERDYITTEDMYEEEIGHFLNAIQKKTKYPFSFNESLKHLKALFALEKSAKMGKFVSLK